MARRSACADASASVTPASTTVSSSSRRTVRGRKARSISASTSNCLRFNFGNRSVPPATNIARGPSSDAMRAASRAVFGRRYLNRGRRSISYFPGWRVDLDGCRKRNVGKPRRPVARRLAFALASQCFDDLLRRHRDLVDPYPQRVVDRGADRGDHRQQRALSSLLGAVWTFGVVGLDDERLDVWHVEERRRLVLEHRRPLVQALAKGLFFHERLA